VIILLVSFGIDATAYALIKGRDIGMYLKTSGIEPVEADIGF